MIPAYILARMRSRFDGYLPEKVMIHRLEGGENSYGAPNINNYKPVASLTNMPCRFVAGGASAGISEPDDMNDADIDLDTLRVVMPANTGVSITDLIIRADGRKYEVVGVNDNESDLIGVIARVKHARG